MDGVAAGEDDPVDRVIRLAESLDCGIQGVEGGGRRDFDGRDEDGLGTEAFEGGGELGGLMAGSGDEDARRVQGGSLIDAGLCCLWNSVASPENPGLRIETWGTRIVRRYRGRF
jgi:hypothetical protein